MSLGYGDFGNADAHSNRIYFGADVLGYLNSIQRGTMMFRANLKTTPSGVSYVCGMIPNTTYYAGWGIRFTSSRYPEFVMGNGGGWEVCTSPVAVSLATWYIHVISWDWGSSGLYAYFWRNNVYSGADSSFLGGNYSGEATDVAFNIGQRGDTAATPEGAAMEISDLMVWPDICFGKPGSPTNKWLEEGEENWAVSMLYHGGIPYPEYLKFWWRAASMVRTGGAFGGGLNCMAHESGGMEGAGTSGTVTYNEMQTDQYCPEDEFIPAGGRGTPSPTGYGNSTEKTGEIPTKLYEHIEMNSPVHYKIDVTLPDGKIWRSSNVSLQEDSHRHGRIKFSPINTVFPDRNYRLMSQNYSLSWLDVNRYLVKQLVGKYENSIRDATIEIFASGLGLDADVTVFKGTIRKWEWLPDTREIRINFGPYDSPLNKPAFFGEVTREKFPGAPSGSLNQPLYILYGDKFYDEGGAISGIKLSPLWSFLSIGQIAIKELWEDDTFEVNFPDGSIQHAYFEEVNGMMCTLYRTVTGGDITVNCLGVTTTNNPENRNFRDDMEYYETLGFGNYYDRPPITNPVQVLVHGLSNCFYGKYRDHWLNPEEVGLRINKESYLKAYSYFSRYGAKCRMKLLGNMTGYQFISNWSSKWRMAVAWNNKGELQFITDELTTLADENSGEEYRTYEEGFDILSNVEEVQDDSGLIGRIEIEHTYKESEGGTTETKIVKDPEREDRKTVNINNDWS